MGDLDQIALSSASGNDVVQVDTSGSDPTIQFAFSNRRKLATRGIEKSRIEGDVIDQCLLG
ncbi:hypothetical protein D3C86_1883290 [compost metagenome]